MPKTSATDVSARREMAADRRRDWQPVKTGSRFEGELVGSTQLQSGRVAMIDDGMGFSLVPWNDALERRIGQQISGIGLRLPHRPDDRTAEGVELVKSRGRCQRNEGSSGKIGGKRKLAAAVSNDRFGLIARQAPVEEREDRSSACIFEVWHRTRGESAEIGKTSTRA